MSDKFESMVSSKFYMFMNFLYKIMLINLLYLFSTALGLILFTFSAATISTYVCMKGVHERKEFPVVKTFFMTFKSVYKKSILITVYYVITFAILGLSFSYYLNSPDTFFNTFGLLVIGLLLVINLGSFIHVILINIYTPDIKFKSKIKYSYLMQLYKPVLTILLIVINALLLVFSYVFVTFSFMFTFAFMAYYNISISSKAYIPISNDHTPLDVESH